MSQERPYEVGVTAYDHYHVTASSADEAGEQAHEEAKSDLPLGWTITGVEPMALATDGGQVEAEETTEAETGRTSYDVEMIPAALFGEFPIRPNTTNRVTDLFDGIYSGQTPDGLWLAWAPAVEAVEDVTSLRTLTDSPHVAVGALADFYAPRVEEAQRARLEEADEEPPEMEESENGD